MFSSLLAAAAPDGDRFASFDVPGWVWVAFVAFVVTLLVGDLLLVHRGAHVITFRGAAIESAVWITIGTSFSLVMLWWQGGTAAGEYLAGYLIEKSLSVDNVFVWAVIFSYFGVPREYQFRVLFWGIFGALVLRAIFIFAGVALIESFDWILYVFGAFLIYTAVKIARHGDAEVHPDKNPALRLVRKVVPSSDEYDGQKLFTRRNGKRLPRPCSRCWCSSRRPTWCSQSTRFRPSWPSAARSSSSSPPTLSPSSGCGRCISAWPAWPAGSAT